MGLSGAAFVPQPWNLHTPACARWLSPTRNSPARLSEKWNSIIFSTAMELFTTGGIHTV
jgi:hypothetical protein